MKSKTRIAVLILLAAGCAAAPEPTGTRTAVTTRGLYVRRLRIPGDVDTGVRRK